VYHTGVPVFHEGLDSVALLCFLVKEYLCFSGVLLLLLSFYTYCRVNSIDVSHQPIAYVHLVSQKSHLWLAVTLTLIFFGRNVTDKASNRKTLCYAASNNLYLCTTWHWQNGETRKLHFLLKCCISALPELNQLLNFYNLFDSRLILTLLYDVLNLVISAFI